MRRSSGGSTWQHPETILDLCYFGLLGAAPYLRAAIVGYEVATLNPALGDAMMFAVKDLDGKPKGWEALVDLNLFYPKPFKQVLLQPDAKA